MLPPDFHSVLHGADTYGIELGAIADDVAAELADVEVERARSARQARIASALPALRVAVSRAFEATQPKRVTLPTLPSAATDLFLFARASAAQVGALQDPATRTFFDVYVAFVDADEWAQLRAVSSHRALDLIFAAAGPFNDLRALWSRAVNWSGIPATSNSMHAPGDLAAVLDRLVASVPNELVATWWLNADGHLQQLIRAAAQRIASKSDPEHYSPRWAPPWEQSEAAE